MIQLLSVLSFLLVSTTSKVYFYENFDGDYLSRWVENSKSDAGKFVAKTPKHAASTSDKKLQTSQDAKFYHISAPFDETIDTSKSTLVVQLSVQFEQDIDCGGGYLKILPPGSDLKNFDGQTQYGIMFGPDVCGYDTKMVHSIFAYKEKNHLIKNKISFSTDTRPHIFTFVLRPDKTYEVLVDGKSSSSGKIEENWDLLPPKTILDPEDKKPEDWVDEKEIPDPEDKKPEDWDKPENIQDPKATKPEDWNDEEDGEWTAPMITNPDYKGEWKPKMISNPKYQGEWVQKSIDNPDFALDDTIGHYQLGAVGIDVWQVKSGTLFDDILITDSEDEAKKYATEMQARIDELNKILDEKKKEEDDKRKAEDEERSKREKEEKSKSGDDKKGDDDEDSEDGDSKKMLHPRKRMNFN